MSVHRSKSAFRTETLFHRSFLILSLCRQKKLMKKLKRNVMKKMIMALAFITVTIGSAAFAGTGGKDIDERIKRAFEKEYAGAADVTWYVYDEYIKVDFSLDGMQLAGFYSKDGRMLGVARNIYFSS